MEQESKMLTLENMASIQKQRTINDAELLRSGAKYTVNEKGEITNLRITDEQWETITIKESPEGKKLFKKIDLLVQNNRNLFIKIAERLEEDVERCLKKGYDTQTNTSKAAIIYKLLGDTEKSKKMWVTYADGFYESNDINDGGAEQGYRGYLMAGEVEKAKDIWVKFAKQHEQKKEYLEAAYGYTKIRDKKKVIEMLKKYNEKDDEKDDEKDYYKLAKIYKLLGDTEKSKEMALKKAKRSLETDNYITFFRVCKEFELKKEINHWSEPINKFINELENEKEKSDRESSPYFDRDLAEAYESLGKHKKAMELRLEAAENTKDPLSRAKYYREIGHNDKAINIYLEMVENFEDTITNDKYEDLIYLVRSINGIDFL